MTCCFSRSSLLASTRLPVECLISTWQRARQGDPFLFAEAMHRLGLLALCIYAFSQPGLLSIGRWAENVYIAAALVLLFTQYRHLLRDIYFKLLLLAVLVQLGTFGMGLLDPEPMVTAVLRPDRLNKLMFFLATAILMAGRLRNIFWVWGCGALGLLWQVLSPVDWPIWQQGLAGVRVDFGIRNAQHTAMYFGILMLGCLCFCQRWMMASAQRWRLPLWLAMLTLTSLGIVVTQTRAIFLAIGVALLLALLLWLWLKRPHRGGTWLVSGAALLITLIGLNGMSIVERRVEQEAPVIQQLLHGDWDHIPYTSVGVRANTWRLAATKIAERPWLGWGPNARSTLIKQSTELPDWVRKQFSHLHNFFIEIQLSYGFAGTLFLLLLATTLMRESLQARHAKVMPTDLQVFFGMFFVYWFIINNFESYMTFKTGVFVFNLVIGGLVTLGWRHRYGAFIPDRPMGHQH